jgi:hypothetical protein
LPAISVEIARLEQHLSVVRERLKATGPAATELRIRDTRRFFERRLSDLSEAWKAFWPQTRAASFSACAGRARKHALEWPSPYNTPPKIVADGKKLQFIITEAIERKEHKPTIDEQAHLKVDRWWRPSQWDYTSTGRLRLTLESCEYLGISHSWAGGKRRKLDTCIGEVLITCQKMATAIKKEREDRARHQRDLERQRVQELEEREREEEYLRKSEVVKKAAESLELSQGIRRLVVCLGSTNKIHELSHDHFSHFKQMLEWCTEYANSLDPTNRLSAIVAEFTSPRRWGW